MIAEKDKAPYDVKKQEESTKENEKLLTQIQKDQDEIQKLRETVLKAQEANNTLKNTKEKHQNFKLFNTAVVKDRDLHAGELDRSQKNREKL